MRRAGKPARKPRIARKGAAPERVLALDTSSTCVGWALFVNDRLTHHGRYPQKAKSHGEKLRNFRIWLLDMYKQYTPDQIVYEKPFAGRRRNAFGVLTMYVAIVLLTHYELHEYELPEGNAVPARDVKKLNKMRKGANHTQNKKIGVLLANRLYGLRLKFKDNDKTKKVSQDDEADAILLGRAWLLAQRPWLFSKDD